MKSDIQVLSTLLENSSNYYLGFDINEEFKSVIAEYKYDKLFIVTDQKLKTLFAEDLHKTFGILNYEIVIINGKESEKNLATLGDLCETLIKSGITKESIVVAFGGGVISNISGLAAALIYRGVRFIEMPTTFMNQTDGTLSNKQGVNGKTNKNLLGCYYSPLFIWGDMKYIFAESLTRIKCGLVESIKNGLIEDKNYLDKIEKYLDGNIKDPNNLKSIIESSIISKLQILKKDPSEKKYGMVLEYGHTFGHAIEKLSMGLKPHGECVAIGMLIASKLSNRLGLLDKSVVDLHYKFLHNKINLNLSIPEGITTEMILQTIESDNKKTGKGIRYVLLEDINTIYNPDGDFMTSVDKQYVKETIDEYMNEFSVLKYTPLAEDEPCIDISVK